MPLNRGTHRFILGFLFIFICLSSISVRSESILTDNHYGNGKIMILEYHKIGYPEARWTRTPENFRKDLQRFYDKGYSLVRLDDFLKNRVKVVKGRTPLILTFDDSSPGQLRFITKDAKNKAPSPGPSPASGEGTKSITSPQSEVASFSLPFKGRVRVGMGLSSDDKTSYRIDPDCAAGILESFYAAHSDFGLAATFFVLPAADPPNRLFNQPEYTQVKLRYLVRKGFEIGNHTYWHATLSKMDAKGVRRQLALAVKAIQEAVPGYVPAALSLPMGIYPQDKSTLLKGDYEGTSYRHIGVMMVSGGPVYPPGHPKFDPLRIPRIQATESELNYWIRYFDKHPEER
ncbi:MAG: polysaccharide deacetylase family protein [Nitrospirae bacterium]|nr:polysaccharide deacetylase family protein [Nitrospirota bacterium]